MRCAAALPPLSLLTPSPKNSWTCSRRKPAQQTEVRWVVGIENMHKARYTISTDSARFDVEVIYRFLTSCYWAEGIPRNKVERSIENALCFGVFDGDKQVGFARVITDRATYAYI